MTRAIFHRVETFLRAATILRGGITPPTEMIAEMIAVGTILVQTTIVTHPTAGMVHAEMVHVMKMAP